MNRAERRAAAKQARRWKLVCKLCRESWPETTTLGEIQEQHFIAKHAGLKVEFELVRMH